MANLLTKAVGLLRAIKNPKPMPDCPTCRVPLEDYHGSGFLQCPRCGQVS